MSEPSNAERPSVRVERAGPVVTVILDRPEVRNAVDRPTAQALADAFLDFERDPDASVAVLWGAGGAFCAGADLKAVAEGGRRANPVRPPDGGPLDTSGPLGASRLVLSKPVIAAVSGHAVAGGLELAVWCDLRVAEEGAVFGVFCRRWGVPLIDGGTIRLPRLIGMSHAMDMILTGRPVDAREALAIGLANRVVPNGQAREAAEALARDIARFPQGCLRADRMSAYNQWDLPFAQALADELRGGRAVIESGETRAGASRFAAGKGRSGSFEDL
jgi:enoyl-CoA hydratase